jgi:prepilin-type processing-associated H-X9-DG protein
MRRLSWCAVPLLATVLLALAAGWLAAYEIVVAMAFGWLTFLLRVGPNVNITWSGLLPLLICLVPLAIGLHAFLCWLTANLGRPDGTPRTEPKRWRARWTAACLTVVMLMFVAGISAAGIAHQGAWLIAARGHWTEYRDLTGSRLFHLREMGQDLPMVGAEEHPGMLPAGATFDADGRPLHGWQTLLLPYLGIRSDHIDREIPWDDPRNATNFKSFIPYYLNPAIPVVRNHAGYGLSHYAGNVHVLGCRPTPLARLPRGTANTLLVGEVASNFKPWGYPLSGRDPTAGLNTAPDGFTSVSEGAVNFAFADGSVRAVRREIDPKVLRAMAGLPERSP